MTTSRSRSGERLVVEADDEVARAQGAVAGEVVAHEVERRGEAALVVLVDMARVDGGMEAVVVGRSREALEGVADDEPAAHELRRSDRLTVLPPT